MPSHKEGFSNQIIHEWFPSYEMILSQRHNTDYLIVQQVCDHAQNRVSDYTQSLPVYEQKMWVYKK